MPYTADNLEMYLEIDEKKIRAAEKLLDPVLCKDESLAEFTSSSSGEIYRTTLNTCSCRDFSTRGGPCKHMIRLAMIENVPITYRKMIPTYATVKYGEDAPAAHPDAPAAEQPAPVFPIMCTLDEFVSILDREGISVEDKRPVGGCLWIENTRKYEGFLASVLVDGQHLSRTPSPRHFKWQYAWFLK